MAFYLTYASGYLLVKSSALDAVPFGHAFSTRLAGRGDDVDLRIRRERPQPGIASREAFFANLLPVGCRLALPHQVHSATVLQVETTPGGVSLTRNGECLGRVGDRIDGDALFSSEKTVAAAVQTADCLPVLLADPRCKAFAAVHSGWRGTAEGIAARVVELLVEKCGSRPEDLVAAVGPGIGACCYEVGEDLKEKFTSLFPGVGVVHSTPDRRSRLNLSACVVKTLKNAGLKERQIDCCQLCTRCHPRYFHSYRRDGPSTGRMISFIFPVVENQPA